MLKAFRYIVLAGLALLLGGCDVAVLSPKGIIAAAEKQLFVDTTILMLIIVIPVIILNFLFIWWYRAKNQKAAYSPNESHNTLIEIICWGIPCIIIGILAVMAWRSSHALDPFRPIDPEIKPYRIEAIALNWKWLFIYPEKKIATVNYLEIPVDAPIVFYITSDGPMNSLAIPRLAGQIYAMAGMRTKLYIKATDLGDCRGFSANLSGNGFSDMHFHVKIVTLDEFNHWVQGIAQNSNPLTVEAFNKLSQPSEHNAVQYFSSPASGLFDNLMMKYMGPDMKGMKMSD